MNLHDFTLLMSAFSLLIKSPFFLYRTVCYLTQPSRLRNCFFGKFFEPRYIIGAIKLDQWAITLS